MSNLPSDTSSEASKLPDQQIHLADYQISCAASQEAEFAEKLRELLRARAITQAELAARVGSSQPAISLMLKRQCRPQKSTILSIASALNVDPRELWRDIEVSDILDTIVAAQESQTMTDAEADALRSALERPAPAAPAAPLPKRKC